MAGKLVRQIRFPGGQLFDVIVYDLLHAPVDVIVNPANGGLSHGGGVAAAIAVAAGDELEAECRALVAAEGRLAVGEAVATTAGRLPFKAVIHVVGPRMGDGDEGLKLARALLAAFRLVAEKGWTSLAFPAVSSGIFAVPGEVCAQAYCRAVATFWRQHEVSPLRHLVLCLYDGPLVQTVERQIDAEQMAIAGAPIG